MAGTHHLRLAPDGNSIFVQNGNSTRPTAFQSYRVSRNWGEDVLTMRIKTGFMDDSYGENTVEGYVMTFGKDGKNFELFAMGQRNPVGADFNKDGEFFTYDSDMEWDMGDPWYRPTNIQHIVSGADFGFRNGSRKHPQWQFDLTPYISEVGAGSPVGFGNGVGLKFPARYQDAFYIDDWSFGNLWAVMLTPDGSSYKADVQPFVSGRPFAVSGTIVNDADSYANEVAEQLRAAGMRVDVDLSNQKINYKVREHSLAHVPLIIAVGRRDMENRTVAIRRLGSDKQEVLELGAAVTTLSKEARPPA